MLNCKHINILTLSICVFMSGCDGATSFSGVILDESGNGVSGARILVTPTPEYQKVVGRPHKATTTSKGEYDLSFAHRASKEVKYKLTVSHPDYEVLEVTVTNRNRKSHDFSLKRRRDPKSVGDKNE